MPDDNGGNPQGSFSNPFLETVAEEDRAVVGKYLDDWDKNISRRFTEKDQEIRPYKELGTPEEVRYYKQLYDMLDSDPKAVYDQIGEALGLTGKQVEKAIEQGSGGTSNIPDELAGYLNPIQSKLDQFETLIKTLAQNNMDTRSSIEQEREDAQLDSFLSDLHEEHGEFDEQYVLLMMHQGMDGEQAVEAFQELVGNYSGGNNQQRFAPLPPALSGGGVPSTQESLGKMDSKTVQGLVANIMSGVSQNNR